MSKINNWITKKYVELKHREEEAQGLAEYGLILALVSLVAVAALALLGGQITQVFNDIVASF
jgi:pilus assembly protein Flp/PilA